MRPPICFAPPKAINREKLEAALAAFRAVEKCSRASPEDRLFCRKMRRKYGPLLREGAPVTAAPRHATLVRPPARGSFAELVRAIGSADAKHIQPAGL